MNIPWTEDQLVYEWRVIYETRIGILTDGRGNETPEQEALARAEADEAVRRLREEQ
jgi:hypothetical protein